MYLPALRTYESNPYAITRGEKGKAWASDIQLQQKQVVGQIHGLRRTNSQKSHQWHLVDMIRQKREP